MLTNLLPAEIDRNAGSDFTPSRPEPVSPSRPIERRLHLVRPQAPQTSQPTHATDRSRVDRSSSVTLSAPDALVRRASISDAVTAEFVQAAANRTYEFRFSAPFHLLVVYEQGARREGETVVEGLPRSTLRDFAQKLAFIPAGNGYFERLEPRTPAQLLYFSFDPAKLTPYFVGGGQVAFTPKLFFEDAALLATAVKLKRALENPSPGNQSYLEALGVVLSHELVRFSRGAPRAETLLRGGLAPWQQRIVTQYIDANLGEAIPLATLARLARLSPHYFCRAFKQSFGVPPHRYHTRRRIEHAKGLLVERSHSVTDIGLTVGYSETSSFTAAFRKATGLTPSAFQRGLS